MGTLASGLRAVSLSIALVLAGACGGGQPGDGNGGDGGVGPGGADAGSGPADPLDEATGCAGVFNPEQVLDYHLEMAQGDWASLLADSSNSIYFEAALTCGDEAPLTVGVRRKRSGGAAKVGLKIDINLYVKGQRFQGLRKLSMENGVSEGDTQDGADVGALVDEYLAWRLMARSGAVSGRAAFARVHVNGDLIGVYVNVEQVDVRFLKSRFGDSSGWLYKKSGGAGDGQKTNLDGPANPYEAYFCFWDRGGGACPTPAADELARTLPEALDIEQMLRFGAANAVLANTDGPLFKDNNYYYYDWPGGRAYLPWDLDTAMRSSLDVYDGSGAGGRTDLYSAVLFTHWEGDYTAILTELVDSRMTEAVVGAELDRILAVAAAALDGDPHATGSTAATVSGLRSYFDQRLADVRSQIAAH